MRFFRFVLGRSNQARNLLLAAVLAGIASGLCSVALLTLISRTLRQPAATALARAGLLFAALCLLVTLSRVASQYLLARLGQGMIMNLRLQLGRQILAAPLARVESLGPHRLLATLTEDVNAITGALVYVPVVGINGAIVAGCMGYLAWLSPRLFLLLAAAIVLGMVTYQIPARLGLRSFRQARQQEDALFRQFRGLTDGIKELKLHRERRRSFDERSATLAELMRRLRLRATIVYSAAATWGHLLFLAAIGILLYLSPAWIGSGRDTLIGYTVALLYMMTPMQVLLDSFPNLGRADVAIERIHELGLSLVPEAEAGAAAPEAAAALHRWQKLELIGVTHSYRGQGPDGTFTLGPLDLALRPGELVFVVGGNGSGKTTLAKILVGLYAPEQGEIRLDGRRLDAAGRDDYRQLFSAVWSDFYVFDTLLGLAGQDLDARARGYLEQLQIAHKLEIRQGRLSTTELSQGQRKRLALLVAYLEDRAIYVFDEWAADQDPVFKELFYHHIVGELKRRGKAVVVISHDDRYFHLADRVLKLDEGKLAAGPMHEALPATELMR